MPLSQEEIHHAIFNRAYRESLKAGLCGWDAMVTAQRELGAFLELQAEHAGGPEDRTTEVKS